jgi:GalNAc-alpha-(1->4)-GalNAc-alpha-(1->3)-diNAcBac-PP-undecaprenol alpha-1,4-N-acetyl-D-galactosaminyltransferase
MGGMERASSTLANHFDSIGIKVNFVSILKKPRFFDLNATIEYSEPSDFNVKKLNLVKTLIWLRREIKIVNAQSFLVYGKFYGALVLLASIGLNKKVYISERSSPFYKWPKNQTIFNRLVYNLLKPTGIIAQTSIAAKIQQKYYGNDTSIKVIPNAVEIKPISNKTERRHTILAVGRFNDHLKGFDRLIEAFALLENKEWRLVFAGDNDNGKDIIQLAIALNVIDRIDFLGKIKEMSKLYAEHGIFVMPSRSEGFPNALAEAMVCGMPCISFDFIAGPRDLIVDGVNGKLVEDGNIKALAKAIDQAILLPRIRKDWSLEASKITSELNPNNIGDIVLNFII